MDYILWQWLFSNSVAPQGTAKFRILTIKKPKKAKSTKTSQKFQEISNSERPVLIDYFATWCQPCRVQSSVLVTVKEQVGDAARIIKIDIDQYPAIASEYNVRGVPTLAIFKNGQLLWKESGVHDVNTLTNLLKQYQ